MSELLNIDKNFEYLKKGSLIGLIIIVIILFSSYYDFFRYVNVQVNSVFILLAWIYLFFNIGIANILKYINEKNMPECPKCKKKLEIDTYKCKKCGKLKFKK